MIIEKLPLTIEKTQRGLLNGEYKCVDLVDSYLSRIQKFDKEINAFITVTDEQAYKQAKHADQILANRKEKAIKDYPLLGAIVGYKDLFLTKGVRTTAASKLLGGYVPAYSATVVDRMEKAGAIMIGKLNCDAWAHGSSGENSDYGATLNPWNKSFTPGGSSSGSGAALAANYCLATTGTDTCGSIRLPASYSGVVGFKPTYGVVPRFGIIAMASSLDSIGHLTHCVADAEAIFKITAGKDGSDSTVTEGKNTGTKSHLRIGVPEEFFAGGLDAEVEEAVERAIKVFEKAGCEVKSVSLPLTKYAISVYYIIQPAEVSSNLGRYDGIRYGEGRETFGDEAKRRIMLGTYVLSSGYYDAYYLRAMKVRSKIIKEVNEVFDKVDAIITPVAPTPPFKLGEKIDDPLKMYLTDIFAATANLAGIPALAIPAGLTKEKLPIGFQLMAPRFSEQILFDLGKLYEKESGSKPLVANLK
jgi:aspartyl-tRNA(Asn)/glutamyl-tRNA(Gln) amidotransferase subunit A